MAAVYQHNGASREWADKAERDSRPSVLKVDPNKLNFSQNSAGGNGRYASRTESVKQNGSLMEPIDVVEVNGKLVSLDNTRVLVAQEQGLSEIYMRLRQATDALPTDEITKMRFPGAQTWGEAVGQRTGNQRPPLPPRGTPNRPRVIRPR